MRFRIALRSMNLAVFLAVTHSVQAAYIPFSGSGSGGFIPVPGGSVKWTLLPDPLNAAQRVWGIAGIGLGDATWPVGSTVEHQFTITFTGLPPGVVINPPTWFWFQ